MAGQVLDVIIEEDVLANEDELQDQELFGDVDGSALGGDAPPIDEGFVPNDEDFVPTQRKHYPVEAPGNDAAEECDVRRFLPDPGQPTLRRKRNMRSTTPTTGAGVTSACKGVDVVSRIARR